MTSVQGIEANAYTQVRVSNFFDDGDPTPLGITVNGEAITLPPLTAFSPVELASVINANTNLQNLNIVAVSDGVNLDIRAFTGEDIVVEITGVGDSADVSKLDPYSPGTPVLSTQTVNAGQGVAVGGNVDVTLANGINFTADTSTVFDLAPVAQSAYLGFQFEIQGETRKGDEFTIEYNTDGVSDNRNALAIGALEAAGLIAGGVASYGESYSQIVEEIGTVTNRTRLETDSAKALLQQTTQYRDSISAVNLDEEAGKLIQYQAAYNASAQVVSVARELFDTLLGAFR
jgi:flagellar hook-associated protein 1 FlgK